MPGCVWLVPVICLVKMCYGPMGPSVLEVMGLFSYQWALYISPLKKHREISHMWQIYYWGLTTNDFQFLLGWHLLFLSTRFWVWSLLLEILSLHCIEFVIRAGMCTFATNNPATKRVFAFANRSGDRFAHGSILSLTGRSHGTEWLELMLSNTAANRNERWSVSSLEIRQFAKHFCRFWLK